MLSALLGQFHVRNHGVHVHLLTEPPKCGISKKMRRRVPFPDGHAQKLGEEGCKTEIELISSHELTVVHIDR
jgi:hypothetical protein